MFRSPGFRFATYYGAFYLTLGAFLPYFPKWLAGRELSAEWIGWIVAAGLAGRTLVSPLGARWADSAARNRDPILLLAIGCCLVFALHTPVHSPWILLVLSFLSGAALFGQIPIIDAFAIRQARDGLFVFGPVRAVGSGMFIISNFAVGALIDWRGSETILVCILFGAAAILFAAARLPSGERAPHPAAAETDLNALRRLLSGPFALALTASALIQGAHGFYYAFSAVAWTAQGYSDLTIGALWASGVAVEIVFLWLSGHGRLGRLSPAALLALGGAGSIVRWGLTAMAPPLPILFAVQCLHAFSFAATYLGFLRFAAHSVPDRYAATGQAINSALAGGVVLALASAVSGYFFAQLGTAGFAIMIIPAAAGLVAALLLLRVSAFPRHDEID